MTALTPAEWLTFQNAFLGEVDGLPDANVRALISAVEYQGFNPVSMLGTIRARAKESSLSDSELRSLIHGGLVLFFMRGSKMGIDKEGTYSMAGLRLIRDLQQKLKVLPTEKGRARGSDTLTLPRLANTFPLVSARILERSPLIRILELQEAIALGLPRGLRWAGGASLCASEDVLRAWISWQCKVDQLINSTGGRKPNPEDVKKFAEIAYRSSLVPAKNRLSLMSQADIEKEATSI